MPQSLALLGLVNGQVTEQGHGQLRVGWQLLCEPDAEFIVARDRRGQGVVTDHPQGGWLRENERSSNAFLRVLAGLLLQVAVEHGAAARKGRAVMVVAETFDAMRGRRRAQSQPHLLLISQCSLSQACVARLFARSPQALLPQAANAGCPHRARTSVRENRHGRVTIYVSGVLWCRCDGRHGDCLCQLSGSNSLVFSGVAVAQTLHRRSVPLNQSPRSYP